MPTRRMTRKAISFRAELYERIRRHCEEQGIAMSAFVEQVAAERLDSAGAPPVSRDDALSTVLRHVPTPRNPKDLF